MRHPKIPLILCVLYFFFMGCQSTKEASYIAQDVSSFHDKKITAITLKNGEVREYDNVGGRYYEEKSDTGFVRKIIGFDAIGTALNINLDRVLEVQSQTTETNAAGTILTVIFVAAAGILLLGLAILSGFR